MGGMCAEALSASLRTGSVLIQRVPEFGASFNTAPSFWARDGRKGAKRINAGGELARIDNGSRSEASVLGLLRMLSMDSTG